jgi:ferric-dicitrate binding protein FerR (iron transport regulator)
MNRIAVVLSLLLLVAAPLRADEGFAMTVALVEGGALLTPAAGGAAGPLAAGASLHDGETVQTLPGGRLEIAVSNGSVIRLGENSRLRLGAAAGHGFSAKLFLGNLWTHVHKLLSTETFEVETENGVAGVRGTEFRVEAGGKGGDLLRVYEGAVEVKGAAGWVHRIEPGHELSFHRDRAPTGPRAFDPASERGSKFMKWVRERAHKTTAPARAEPPPHEKREPPEHERRRREHRK